MLRKSTARNKRIFFPCIFSTSWMMFSLYLIFYILPLEAFIDAEMHYVWKKKNICPRRALVCRQFCRERTFITSKPCMQAVPSIQPIRPCVLSKKEKLVRACKTREIAEMPNDVREACTYDLYTYIYSYSYKLRIYVQRRKSSFVNGLKGPLGYRCRCWQTRRATSYVWVSLLFPLF